jgi:hypothetical protein
VVYRKGELSRAAIDRDWPDQLALSAESVRGKNCIIIERFCRGFVDLPTQAELLARPTRWRLIGGLSVGVC